MIRTEESGNFVKHYSDLQMFIRQEETGNLYDIAIDVIPCRYTYTETDIPIPEEEGDDDSTT